MPSEETVFITRKELLSYLGAAWDRSDEVEFGAFLYELFEMEIEEVTTRQLIDKLVDIARDIGKQAS